MRRVTLEQLLVALMEKEKWEDFETLLIMEWKAKKGAA